MKCTAVLAITIAALVPTSDVAFAQSPAGPADSGTRFARAIRARYDNIKRDIVEAAEAVPGSEYSFRPTAEVRTFGQIIGHIADSQNFFCGVAAGANPDYLDPIEKSGQSKGALVQALKDSMAACDRVYAATDAENVMELVKAGQGDALRSMTLLDNVSHDNEHYGNIVTYMRLKGRVPPSTARGTGQ